MTPAKPPAATTPTYVRSGKHDEESPKRKDKRSHLVRHNANGIVLLRINLWIPIDVATELDTVAARERRDKGAIVSDGLEMYFANPPKSPSRKR